MINSDPLTIRTVFEPAVKICTGDHEGFTFSSYINPAQKLPYNPTRVFVFGSYATGMQRYNSDLDLLLDFQGRKCPPYDLILLKLRLSDVLVIGVDLLTDVGLDRISEVAGPTYGIKKRIYASMLQLYPKPFYV